MQFADIAYALKRETAAPCFCAEASAFYLLCALCAPAVPFRLIPPPQRGVFARCICCCSAARLSGTGRLFFRKVVLYPEKDYRNAAPVIYSAVSYRFYNVFYKKGFTNEFQKHII